MKLRCVSCTASSEACHAQTPQRPEKSTITTAMTAGLASMGAEARCRNWPMRPPLCCGGEQSIWLGSFPPFSMAAAASSAGVVGQQGQPLVPMHGQQSILPAAARRASNVARAAKKKICSRNSMSTASAAYMQKEDRAGRAEETEMAKATKSVRDVTMIETPAWEIALAMRSDTGSAGLVRSNAFMITKESSTPMPRITKGRMPCAGV
mmetsp:Transcript_3336/g.8421  ORF Transcript_3336/g.8421 Transcript_3336/m.8421 type:complete len:208 (+) Transcript_3336:1937-2560(+)